MSYVDTPLVLAAACRRYLEVYEAGGPTWGVTTALIVAAHANEGDEAYIEALRAPGWQLDADGNLPTDRSERSTRAAITDDLARDQAALDRGDAPL